MFCFCHGRVCVISDHIVKEKKKWNGNDCDDVGNQTPYIYIYEARITHTYTYKHTHTFIILQSDVMPRKKRGDEDKKKKEEKYTRMK